MLAKVCFKCCRDVQWELIKTRTVWCAWLNHFCDSLLPCTPPFRCWDVLWNQLSSCCLCRQHTKSSSKTCTFFGFTWINMWLGFSYHTIRDMFETLTNHLYQYHTFSLIENSVKRNNGAVSEIYRYCFSSSKHLMLRTCRGRKVKRHPGILKLLFKLHYLMSLNGY